MRVIFIGLLLVAVGAQAADVSVGFSPCWKGRPCAETLVVQTIEQAHAGQPLRLAAYGLTSKRIAQALIDAHTRGVDVRVVADAKANARKFSVVQVLANKGIPVRLNDRYAILHDKFMLIGDDLLQTGSMNYTKAGADSNAENVLVIRGERQAVKQYREEWQRLWEEGNSVGVIR